MDDAAERALVEASSFPGLREAYARTGRTRAGESQFSFVGVSVLF